LILDGEVLMYSTSTTSRGSVLVADDLEVLALVYLRKGNTSVVSVDNSSVELQVVVGGETLVFLGQKPGLLQSQLLLFSALVLDFVDEPGIEDAYSLWHVSSGGDRKYALFEKASDFGLTRILILNVVLKEYSNVGVFTRSASTTL
jgi:hypothetical protein